MTDSLYRLLQRLTPTQVQTYRRLRAERHASAIYVAERRIEDARKYPDAPWPATTDIPTLEAELAQMREQGAADLAVIDALLAEKEAA